MSGSSLRATFSAKDGVPAMSALMAVFAAKYFGMLAT